MFWKHLTVLPIALLLREVKQSQTDRLTSRHVRQNMSPILKTLELSGNSSFPGVGWGHRRVWESHISPCPFSRQNSRGSHLSTNVTDIIFLMGTGNHSNLNGPTVSKPTFPLARFTSSKANAKDHSQGNLQRDGENSMSWLHSGIVRGSEIRTLISPFPCLIPWDSEGG